MLRVKNLQEGRSLAVVAVATEQDAFVCVLTPTEARRLAHDLISEAACAEAESLLHGFFEMLHFPESGLKYMVNEFKDYRARVQTGEPG